MRDVTCERRHRWWGHNNLRKDVMKRTFTMLAKEMGPSKLAEGL